MVHAIFDRDQISGACASVCMCSCSHQMEKSVIDDIFSNVISKDRVQQLAYVMYVRKPIFLGVHMILDMHMFTHKLIFPYEFSKFSKFFWFLEFYTV